MHKTLIAILFALLLGGCSALAGLLPFSSGPSVGVDVGDKEANVAGEVNKDETSVEGDVEVEAEKIEGDVKSNTAKEVYQDVDTVKKEEAEQKFEGVESVSITNIDPFFLILMILGWLLPSPSAIYKEIKSWFVKS